MPNAKCRYFLKCTSPATTKVQHPILGEVECCERCAKFSELPRVK